MSGVAPTHPRRFYQPELEGGARLALDREEAHHVTHVLRLGVGEHVTLFDGGGRECKATIIVCDRRHVEVETAAPEVVEREPALALTLAFAVPKGRHADLIIEKGAELGVAAFVPMHSRHAVVDAATHEEKRFARWRRLVIEVCKQCGRNRLPVIAPVTPFAGLVSGGDFDLRLLAHPAPTAANLPAALAAAAAGDRVLALVGPEGGFHDDEVDQALAAGFAPVSLGRARLRVETAALAVAAAVALCEPAR